LAHGSDFAAPRVSTVTIQSRTPDTLAQTLLPPSPLAEAALRSLDDGIAILDPDGLVTSINPAMERLVGRDAIGDARQILERLRITEPMLREARAAGSAAPFQLDDRERTRGIYEISVKSLDGRQFLVHARDITALVEAERRARAQLEENESFRIVACLLAEESDIHQVLELLSAQAESQCDGDGATVIEIDEDKGRAVASVGMLVPLRGREFRMGGSLAEHAIATRTPVTVDDFQREYPNHAWSDAAREVDAGPLLLAPLFAHDELMGIVAVTRKHGREPFTSREIRRIRALADQAALALWKARLLEEAEAANRAKNDFIAVMSHELRTPLAAVTGYEELLADEILGTLNEEQHNAVDRMRWSTRLLANIIEEILTFSRLESGNVHLNFENADVAEILKTAGAVIEPLATARGLAFRINPPAPPIEITTDADVVRRVIVNLGANAVKFTERGEVELTSRIRDNHVVIAIRDTGIGIAEADLGRIFEAFTQVHTGPSRPYGGTGLGLHTAHRLARLIGGRIEVQSVLGEGSTFSLVLPLPGA
jgi:signal transduction histidine kinase